MGWEPKYRYRHFGYTDELSPLSSFRINEQCFIRKQHKCWKIYEASKSCFIACPTDESLEPILELMSEKISRMGIEPIIAIKERAYGQDIFCTKICGKIIESRFCIVILNDTIIENTNIPNPNVYYEYGLMTALRKHIIPLQKEDLKLAFNIQSYDTIKYRPKNIGSELDRAIKDAIRITESQEKEERKTAITEKTIMRKLELGGLKLKDENWFLSEVIGDTLFYGFGQYEKIFYLYLGKIDRLKEFQNYLEDLAVVIHRTEEKGEKLDQELADALKTHTQLVKQKKAREKKEKASQTEKYFPELPFESSGLHEAEEKINDLKSKKELMSAIYIGFIINPQLSKTKFLNKAKDLIKPYKRYKITNNTNNKIEFGDIKIILDSPQY